MANEEQLAILRQGASAWNAWRAEHPEEAIDLHEAILSEVILHGADLSRADLGGAVLVNADLRQANLTKADLSGADLSGAALGEAVLVNTQLGNAHLINVDLFMADLSRASLFMADLREAHLINVDLFMADLSRASLFNADLRQANLRQANLFNADLTVADLRGASLTVARLSGAKLSGARLSGVDLRHAYLSEVDLRHADLRGADLSGADLRLASLIEANLNGATLTDADLSEAILIRTNLQDTKLNNCRVYGIAAWDLNLAGAEQSSLIITPHGEPTITVDNLKVAQFVYLLLNNAEIRHVIDTITSKVVLILGRFTPERKAILDAIRDELRRHDFLPVLFDFQKPESRDFTETVSTLAHMARFVIADMTEPRIVLEEVTHIVPNLAVPLVPLLLEGKEEPVTLSHLRRISRCVLPTYRYTDRDDLLASLEEKVIVPAQAKVLELREIR